MFDVEVSAACDAVRVSEQSGSQVPVGPLVSVRSEVSRIVDPDSVDLGGVIGVTRNTKEEALRGAAVALDSVKAALTAIGGLVQSAATVRAPVTWATKRVTTTPEFDQKERTQTGRIVASVHVSINLRDFDLLEGVEQITVDVQDFRIVNAGWAVDTDNAAWPDLRSEAIREALRKGRDYAVALGAEVATVEHVADAGLLGGDEAEHRVRGGPFAAMGGGGGPVPTLDPVPQTLTAAIEARFRITPVQVSLTD
jgi:hypothetical protein